MDNVRSSNRNFEMAGWGALFIWWGISVLFTSLPPGTCAIGTGLILLGLTAARRMNGILANGFTTTVGILALVLGGLEMSNWVLRLPFELPAFAIVLIVLGVVWLAREILQTRNA
jgi:hypothetical protein